VVINSGLFRRWSSLFVFLKVCLTISIVYASTPLDDVFLKNHHLSQAQLESLYQYKLDRGINNLTLVSSFLLRGSDQFLRQGKLREAVDYAEYALMLSPAYPPAYSHLGKVYWAQNRLRIFSAPAGWLKALRATCMNYFFTVFFLSNTLYLFLLSFLLMITLFASISLYKYVKLFIHDVRHLMPVTLPGSLFVLWGGLIVFLPFFFHWSIFLIVIYWLMILFVYHTKREQQIIIIFAFFFLSSPFLMQLISKFSVTSSSGVFYHLYQISEENWDRDGEEKLRAWVEDYPNDVDALFALGLVNKKKRNYDEAQRYYERALQVDARHYRTLCNLGNVFLAVEKPERAIEYYNRCIENYPSSVKGYYNLSRAQLLEYMFVESKKSFNRAKEIDPDRVDYFSRIHSENMNRIVIDETIPLQVFWEKTFQPTEAKELFAANLWDGFFKGIPFKYWYSVLFVFLAFVSLIFVDRYRSPLSLRCEYCGCAVCKKCKTLVPEYNLCKQCAGIFKGKRDSIGMSVQKKEKQVISIERFHKSHIIIGKILSILIPGAGHLWLDKPFKGAVLSFAFFFLVLQLVPVRELVVNPWLLIGSSSLGGITLLGGRLIINYWYSISNFTRVSSKLSQFLSLIRVTRKELQIKQ
jgi:tetratricopeptide (TPR) repeat protein